MKLPDVNIWLALTLSGHSHHRTARTWFESRSASDSLFFCRVTQQGFMRLLTTRAVLAPYGIEPLTNREAWRIGESFFEDARIAYAREPEGIEERWRSLALGDSASPKLWMDAWLAAFALCSRFQLVTIDKGFKKFEGLDALILDGNSGGK